jgi:hypothetical protein
VANKKFQNKYRIPSARARWHDYSGGAYFITVCTKNTKTCQAAKLPTESKYINNLLASSPVNTLSSAISPEGLADAIHISTSPAVIERSRTMLSNHTSTMVGERSRTMAIDDQAEIPLPARGIYIVIHGTQAVKITY